MAASAAASLVSHQKRGHALGMMLGGMCMGMVLGVSLGLIIAEHLGWQGISEGHGESTSLNV